MRLPSLASRTHGHNLVPARMYVVLVLLGWVMVSATWVGYQTINKYVMASPEVIDNILTSREIEQLVAMVRKAESGQRGYLHTLDSAYLRPYDMANREVPSIQENIITKHGKKNDKLKMLMQDVDDKMRELRLTVSLAKSGRISEANRVMKEGSGRLLMVKIENSSQEMISSLDRETSEKLSVVTGHTKKILSAIPFVVSAIIPCILVSVWYCAAQSASRTKAMLDRDREREAKNQAEAEAMVAKAETRHRNQMFNALAHDFRFPLNGILQQLTRAEFHLATNNLIKIDESIKACRKSALGMRDQFEGYLEAARSSSNKPQVRVFRVLAAIESVVGFISPLASEKGLNLGIRCSPELLGRTDPKLLNRILMNLVGNACKYTERGSVIISAEPMDGPEGGFSVSVSDSGIGIKPEDIQKLFQDFAQVGNLHRDPSQGFGLGLSNVKRICSILGGNITVNSQVGRGSVFRVELPDLPLE